MRPGLTGSGRVVLDKLAPELFERACCLAELKCKDIPKVSTVSGSRWTIAECWLGSSLETEGLLHDLLPAASEATLRVELPKADTYVALCFRPSTDVLAG